MNIKNQSGSLLIEVLVSSAIIVIFSVAIGGLVTANNRLVTAARHESQATALAKEAMEQAMAVKQSNWSDVGGLAEGNYIIQRSGNAFVFIPSNQGEAVDETYTRTVKVSKAYRDVQGDLALSGLEDPNVRSIEAIVSWDEHGQEKNLKLNSFITNWKGI
jgi:type II secretory pathway pseudopilin PulG